VIRLPTALDEDPEVLDFFSRRLVVSYALVDVYNRSLAMQGFADEAAAIASAWKAGDRDGAPAHVSATMIEELLVTGDKATCSESLRAFRDAGVKTPVLFPFSVAGDPADRITRVKATTAALAPKR
jgi:hypothetical protein